MRNFDATLGKLREKIAKGNYVYLHVEGFDENEHRHKLAAMAAVLYPTLEEKDKSVLIKREDEDVKCEGCDCVAYAPTPRTKHELQGMVCSMTVEHLSPVCIQQASNLSFAIYLQQHH